MRNKLTFTFIFVLMMSLVSTEAEAQNYEMAAGLRLGYPSSVSFKYFISESAALEAYVGTRGYNSYRWTNVSGAYLIHKDLDWLDGLQYYFGGGLSAFLWNYDNNFIGDNSSTTTIGIQGYLGLDYTFANAPINITTDWVPTYFVNGFGDGFNGGYGSLGVRYILR